MPSIEFDYMKKEHYEEVDEEGIIEPFFYYRVKQHTHKDGDEDEDENIDKRKKNFMNSINTVVSLEIKDNILKFKGNIIKCPKCKLLYILSIVKKDRKDIYKLIKKQSNCCPYCGHARWVAKKRKRKFGLF